MQELHTAPAKMPPDDWRPKMAGLAVEKPRAPIPTHCLDGRSVPLRVPGEPHTPLPEFVPPEDGLVILPEVSEPCPKPAP